MNHLKGDPFTAEECVNWWNHAAIDDPFRQITGGHCDNFEKFVGNGYVETRPVLPLIERLLGKSTKRASLVEYGCGVGRLAFWFHLAFRRVYGVDAAPAMIEQAKKMMPGPQYLVCDGRSIPLKANAVDVVFSKITFQHMPREAVHAVFADARRVLKPQGVLVFQLPTCERDDEAQYPGFPNMVARWSRREISESLVLLFKNLELAIGEHWGYHVARK